MAKGDFSYDTVFMEAGLDILQKIRDNEKMTISKLADIRGRRVGNTSSYTTKMEKQGYLSKDYTDGEGSEKIITLTDKGRKALQVSGYEG